MGLKEKLPLLNSDNKRIRIAGYVVYASVFLVILGAILASRSETASVSSEPAAVDTSSASESTDSAPSGQSSSEQYHSGFDNHTIGGHDDVSATGMVPAPHSY